MDSVLENASSIHKKTHLEANVNEENEQDLPKLGSDSNIKKDRSSSSSSSSDSSSDEDFFQLDTSELRMLMTGNGEMSSNNPRPPQYGEVAGINLTRKHGDGIPSDEESMFVGSNQVPARKIFSYDTSSVGPGFSYNLDILGAKQSPPIQVMGRSDVPDPNRIPSSVFTRTKSTTPMEWSVASNESLFSIHMGNSSFSRDHVILLGRSGDLTNFSSSQLDGYPPISHPLGSSPVTMGMGPKLVQTGSAEVANAETMKDFLRAATEEDADKDKPRVVGVPLSLPSLHSDGSGSSFRSFAFPILTGEGRSGSMKIERAHQPTQTEQPQQPPLRMETPKAVHKAAKNKLFHCFSCCHFSC